MSWCSRPDAWGLAALLLVPGSLFAQARNEVQLWGVALGSRPAVLGGGLGLARRDARRSRVAFAAAAGATREGDFAARGELAWHFLLDPARSGGGWGVYAGGGLAMNLVAERRGRPYVQAVLGVEADPGGGGGLFLEAGFGGGLRAAAGWRWRKRLAPGSRARGAVPRRGGPPAQDSTPAVSGRGTTGRQ